MITENHSNLLDGKYGICDLVDLDRLRKVFEKFTEATGFTIGFLDHPGLNVLIGTGWRRVCTEFHRSCPVSHENCIKSNHRLLDRLTEPGKVEIEACDNGLVDCATPIIVKGKHIASLATGQLLLAPPDIERFKRQAALFGFDEQTYLAALEEIPVVEEKQLLQVTAFLGEIALIISEQGYGNLEIQEKASRLEREIAERKRIETALCESEEQYRALIETTDTGFVIIDAAGIVLNANSEYVRLTGRRSLEEITGKSVLEWTAPSEKEKNEQAVKACFRDGKIRNFEIDYIDGCGRITPIEINATVVEIGGGKRILTICRDITERKNREEIKAELISTVSHELRTPLVPIKEGINMVLEGLSGPLNDEQRNLLLTSRANVSRLVDMVNNFLDFQKLEAGMVQLRFERCNLNGLIREVAQDMASVFANRSLGFALELDDGLPEVEWDPQMMMRVVVNLLHNAARFTPQGKITVRTVLEGERIRVSVCDTGIGIKPEDLPVLFRKFVQLEDGKKLICGGTGLGLVIAKSIVEKHGGQIWAESTFGKGSVFSFSLPLTVPRPIS
ncbi:MAG: PocR ligand-binding domain-containing protein [Candidatus Omnitrophota bacterium]